MTKITKDLLTLLLCFSVFVTCSSNNSIADNSTITKIEDKNYFLPDGYFFDQDANKVFLDQFEGKTILICFWASWCGSCVEELPILDVLQKDFRKLPFEVIAISEDFKGVSAIQEYFSKYGIRHLEIYHDYQNNLFKEMSVAGLPTAFLVSPEGRIKMIFKGNIKWYEESIRAMLLAEIAGNPETPKNSYVATSLNKKISLTKKDSEEILTEEEKTDITDMNNEKTAEAKNNSDTDNLETIIEAK